jgi:hypothetical protein
MSLYKPKHLYSLRTPSKTRIPYNEPSRTRRKRKHKIFFKNESPSVAITGPPKNILFP